MKQKTKNKKLDKHEITEMILKLIDKMEGKYNIRIYMNIDDIKTTEDTKPMKKK